MKKRLSNLYVELKLTKIDFAPLFFDFFSFRFVKKLSILEFEVVTTRLQFSVICFSFFSLLQLLSVFSLFLAFFPSDWQTRAI